MKRGGEENVRKERNRRGVKKQKKRKEDRQMARELYVNRARKKKIKGLKRRKK